MSGMLRDPFSCGSHLLWFVLAIPACACLWQRSRGDRPKQLSLLVYGISMIFCFGASALFHGVRLPAHQVKVFEVIDYIGIFLFVAGSWTPLAFNLVGPRWRWPLLRMTWGLTALGIGLRLLFPYGPLWLFTLLFFSIGWGVLVCCYELMPLSARALRPVLIGGLLYTLGGALNLLRWPVVWPGVLAYHEVFHLVVMAGSLIHFAFMLDVVVPWRRDDAEAAPEAVIVTAPMSVSQ